MGKSGFCAHFSISRRIYITGNGIHASYSLDIFAHENSVISELEPDHKMDKRLKIADIAARTELSIEYGFAGAGWQSEYQCTRSRTGAGLRA